MIRVRGLSFSFGEHPVLRDGAFHVARGEVLGILGPNGSGKSTLLALLRGTLRPDSGSVEIDGQPLRGMPRRQVARRIAVVPQSVVPTFPFPVREFVAMGRFPHRSPLGGGTARDESAVAFALDHTRTRDLSERPVTELSGGELQRVALARALAQEAPILLLDEVTSHLDIDHTLEVMELVLALNRDQGLTVVQVSHDAELAAASSDRLLLLSREGRIVSVGAPEAVLTTENLREVYRADLTVERNPHNGLPWIVPAVGFSAGRRGRDES
ncbi:MAG: ABC transporter ATP-binding protein [Deferrisomatales bacterium]|nr:ABC transporter ATP-binding protein [Deferrisomatales bacterium]